MHKCRWLKGVATALHFHVIDCETLQLLILFGTEFVIAFIREMFIPCLSAGSTAFLTNPQRDLALRSGTMESRTRPA